MFTHCELLPPATKLGQGNIFRSVYQEFCSLGGSPGLHPRGRLRCLFGGIPRPTPKGEVEGLAGGVSRPTPRGEVEGSGWEGVSRSTPGGLQDHTWGVSKPRPRGCISAYTEADTPQADGYCCGRYASYWNAFLFPFQPSTPGNRTRFSSNDSIWTEIVEQKRNE